MVEGNKIAEFYGMGQLPAEVFNASILSRQRISLHHHDRNGLFWIRRRKARIDIQHFTQNEKYFRLRLDFVHGGDLLRADRRRRDFVVDFPLVQKILRFKKRLRKMADDQNDGVLSVSLLQSTSETSLYPFLIHGDRVGVVLESGSRLKQS